MTDVYKIGITVALENLIGMELIHIIDGFGKADKAAKDFSAALGLIATAGAIAGAALMAGVKEASKFETELAKFRLYGLGDKLNNDAKDFAMNMKVAGVNYTESMHLMSEAQGVFRESGRSDAGALEGAKMAAPTMAKLSYIDKALYGKDDSGHASPESLSMLRWIDMTGGAQDANRFNELADLGFKLKTTSGGQIDWEQLRQFRARAKTAGFGFSDDMYAMAEPIIGELKGSTAGTSLSTAYNRAHGIIKVPNQAVAEYLKLGLWDKGEVQTNSLGGIKKLKGDPLVDAAGYDKNFIKWYMDHVIPAYDKLGLSQDQRIRENAMLFGGTGGNIMSLIERQKAVIDRSYQAVGKAHSIDQAVHDADATPAGKVVTAHAEYDKLMYHLGEVVLPVVNKGLEMLTSILDDWVDWFKGGELSKAQGRTEHWDTSLFFSSLTRSIKSAWDSAVNPPQRNFMGNQVTVIELNGHELGRAVTKTQSDFLQSGSNSGSSSSSADYNLTPYRPSFAGYGVQ